jgi:hypothetical protein
MKRVIRYILLMSILSTVTEIVPAAGEAGGEVKELSGISIVGNKEAPKSLYIVPWKNSEVGIESSLNHGLIDDGLRPIDKEVFMREQDFFDFVHGNK